MSTSNGHPIPKPPLDRRQLREQRRLVESQIELARLTHVQQLLESWNSDWWFGGSDLWDRARPRDQSGDGGRWLPLAQPGDRRHGAQWPLWRNPTELFELLQQSRVLCTPQGNAYAWSMLQNLINYIVGDGCSYEVGTTDKLPDADPGQPGKQAPAALQQQVAKAQDVLDRFLKINRWNLSEHDHESKNPLSASREQETVRRQFRDGDVLWRMYRQADGEYGYRKGDLLVRFVEPECLVDPPSASVLHGWSYGIQHQIEPFEDVETPLMYSIRYPDPTTPDHAARQQGADNGVGVEVDAEEIIHLKGPHTDSTVKRGTPWFIGSVASAFHRADKLQRTLSMTDAVRAGTAELWKHATATASNLSNMASTTADRTRYNTSTGKTEQVEEVRPGKVRRMDAGWEQVPPFASDSAGFLATIQGDLQQAVAAFCAPQYMAGDASNNNYASIKESGTPFVRFCKGMQGYFAGCFARMTWAALKWAAECGLIDPAALPYLTLTVKAPDVAMRAELDRAQEDQILVPLGVKSVKTAQMERGLNADEERANQQEEAKFQQAMQPPPQVPPGTPPGTQEPPPGGPHPPAPPPPAPKPRLPHHNAVTESRLLEEYTEADHPRDDHGHWVSKGDLAAAKTDHAKAEALRAKVTDPEQRAKLEMHLKATAPKANSKVGKKPKKPAAIRAEMHGAQRVGEGKEARITLADGSPAPAHITPAMVPPAWRDVRVSLDPNADVLVTARDEKGNTKTVYSDNWDSKAAARKFSRIHEAMRMSADMAHEIQRDRRDPKKRDSADCAWLMSVQGTRPGSEADNKGVGHLYGQELKAADVTLGAADKQGVPAVSLKVGEQLIPVRDKKARAEIANRVKGGDPLHDSTYWLKSFGATTLEGRHVVVTGAGVVLRFMGKESVYHEHYVRDPELAAMLKDRAVAAGATGKLFPGTNDAKAGDYVSKLDGGKFTPKDLRTTRGTAIALREVARREAPKTEKEYRAACMEVAGIASSVLGNEPAQALESYISPVVFSGWRAGLKKEVA